MLVIDVQSRGRDGEAGRMAGRQEGKSSLVERCHCHPIIRQFLTLFMLQLGISRVFGEGKETVRVG